MAAKKTKIKMLTSIAGNADPRYDLTHDFSFEVGKVYDVHAALAQAWIAGGIAELAQ